MFPPLPYESWSDTLLGLHLVTQIVGKVRLALHPPINHWWHATLYVSPRGLTTGAIPLPASREQNRNFDVEIDLRDHRVVTRTSDGRILFATLADRPVCDFYREFTGQLQQLGIDVAIDVRPYKCRSTIPYDRDREHGAYDRRSVQTACAILHGVEAVFAEFRSRFLGKCSPVHLFWHSFDLAVTRFSGRRAPALEGQDRVAQEAYSHEVNSAGFWFGDNDVREPAFYCYTAPAPPGMSDAMTTLRYDEMRTSPDPRRTLLDFLQGAYEAGANAARWDRASLER
ncbi:MAG TPA: DUF5996 family protein [Planctomycetota bacterium]|nr:DUF5996 family protein [Planctomycetota bacterium]